MFGHRHNTEIFLFISKHPSQRILTHSALTILPSLSGQSWLRQRPAQHAPLPGSNGAQLPPELSNGVFTERGHLPAHMPPAVGAPAAQQRHPGPCSVTAGC